MAELRRTAGYWHEVSEQKPVSGNSWSTEFVRGFLVPI